jgi:acetyl esterase
VGAVRDLTIDGAVGPLQARHYAPAAAAADAPLLVYYHGGGFVIGDLDTHDAPCRMLCADGAQHVLSVAYRLAPEHPFPAAVDDALAAFRWARTHAASLGAGAARVTVGGDSAGGNLAAVVSQLAARAGDPPVAQLLVYPVTDGVERRPSDALFDEGWFLSQRDRRAFAAHYHGSVPVAPGDARLAPLRAADLSGLPPALVVTAGFDILRDEGEAYAEALRAAGTPVRALRVRGFGHGFLHVATVLPGARRAMREVAAAWRALLADGARSDTTITAAARGAA